MSIELPASRQPSRRALAPALGLFLLAPLVGEFLLGNLAITWLWTLLTLAPLYGGGALLIRELARRFSLGWPSMLILGLAYALIEEAFVTESLFNPDYVGLRLLDFGYLPVFGIGAWWTVFVLALHTIWSTAVPIALVESLAFRSRRTPWLGPTGLALTAIVFVAGYVVTQQFQPPAKIGASTAQLVSSVVIVATLVALAVFVGRHRPASRADSALRSTKRLTLSPVLSGVMALAGGSAFMGLAAVHSAIPATVNVAAMLIVLGAIAVAVLRWSRRTDWTERHRLAVAGGFLLTYAWHSFVQVPSVGDVSPTENLVGDLVFSAGAVALLITAFVRVARAGDESARGGGATTAEVE
jgi:hypothetical protein